MAIALSANEKKEAGVRSMFDGVVHDQLLRRLRRLTSDSPARWGRMTAPQMIAHLSDQLRHTLDDRPTQPKRVLLRWPIVRYLTIYWLPWPKGRVQGPPEAFLSQPTTWAADVAALEKLVERFAARNPGDAWPEHALFGRMSGKDWGVFCYRHFDHHFRQFGV